VRRFFTFAVFFGRTYLSNGRAIGMVVVCLSVCLSICYLSRMWWPGVGLTPFIRSTKLLYAGPG